MKCYTCGGSGQGYSFTLGCCDEYVFCKQCWLIFEQAVERFGALAPDDWPKIVEAMKGFLANEDQI